jgi:transcriptional regulator with XRE-family HTH domain
MLPRLQFDLGSLRESSTLVTEGQWMNIGERLRALREGKKFSQRVLEERTGLLRCYISRVEHGHTVPAVETLEKFARALEVPMYQLFYDGEEPPKQPNLPKRRNGSDFAWGVKRKDARMVVVPVELERRLPPPPPDCERVAIGGHIGLRNRNTKITLDIFHFE